MSKEKHLSYQEVANIASLLCSEGKRVTLEYVRRQLGKGTHSQIAILLSKWQQTQSSSYKMSKNKNLAIKRNSNATLKGRSINSKKNVHRLSNKSTMYNEQHHAQKHENLPKNVHIKKEKKIIHDKSRTPSVSNLLNNPFSLERLNQETTTVKSLFWALYQIKSMRLNTLEIQQKIENSIFILRMEHESGIRQIKQQNRAKIAALVAEFNHIKAANSRKISDLRQQLAL